MTTSVRALIVDDEPLARDNVRLLLNRDPEVELVAECEGGEQAVAAILEGGVDLVFLDVQMPRVDGLDVITRVGFDRMPVVVFVTAFDEYALAAFEHRALDFLLKPFTDERFAAVLARAKAHVREHAAARLGERMAALVDDLAQGEEPPPDGARLTLKTEGRLVRLDPARIRWIEAADYRLRIHHGGDTVTVRRTMDELEGLLDERAFVRVHRSAIVNLGFVREVTRGSRGETIAVLEDGTPVRVARSRRRALVGRLAGG